ncbi:hypothetical protein [Nostoc sp. MG11]|uniref:hypothetical protein n=1 Tax=Nostoc sp. MG11 TaxID=2721166 RepID=UPI001867400F|nr:hypothetical protein [Nostoc sp. MG11]
MTTKELIEKLQAHPENALVILEEYEGEEFYIRAIAPVDGKVLIQIEADDERGRRDDEDEE